MGSGSSRSCQQFDTVRAMKIGSVFTGIGAWDLGFEMAGHEIIWQCENDKHCRKVLRRHWPDENVPLYGDVKDIGGINGTDRIVVERPDVLIGGWPCQGISIGGKRQGLADARSAMWFEYIRLVEEIRPKIFMLENVPGILSSNRGQDLALITTTIQEHGYEFAWRIVDSASSGVPQRRRRWFCVASRLGTESCLKVLFEQKGMPWNPPTSSRQRYADPRETENGSRESGREREIILDRASFNQGKNAKYNPYIAETETCPPLVARGPHAVMRSTGFSRYKESDVAGALRASQAKQGDTDLVLTPDQESYYEKAPTLLASSAGTSRPGGNAGNEIQYYVGARPRRLTMIECERLSGLPDDWTKYGPDGEVIADGHRYKQCGNCVTVNVAHFFGHNLANL